MRFASLLCVILLIWPVVGFAGAAHEYVQTLSNGTINWSKGILTAKGICPPMPHAMHASRSQGHPLQTAQAEASRHLLGVIKNLRLDATRQVADVIETNEQFSVRLLQMVDDAPIAQEQRLLDGSLAVTVQMSLLGGFLQLMLPDEIKQVEPIRPVNSSSYSANDMSQPHLLEAIPKDEGIYTGLVVDARGIGAKPAMVSVIVDESGKEVYGSAFVSREYAVQYGVCQYVRADPTAAPNPRVAPKPLIVKGLRTLTERDCDIVISNTDAAKLRDASANLSFLKQCRVIIILD